MSQIEYEKNMQFEHKPKYKAAFMLIIRVLAVPTAIISCFTVYDIIAPACDFDQATITRKYTLRRKAGISYNINAKGNFRYNEGVNRQFYNTAKVGDEIKVSLSKFFGEWKSLELLGDSQAVAKTVGTDIYYMGIFGMLFLVALFAFLQGEVLFSKLILLICIPLFEFTAILLWIKLILVWTGVCDKM